MLRQQYIKNFPQAGSDSVINRAHLEGLLNLGSVNSSTSGSLAEASPVAPTLQYSVSSACSTETSSVLTMGSSVVPTICSKH